MGFVCFSSSYRDVYRILYVDVDFCFGSPYCMVVCNFRIIQLWVIWFPVMICLFKVFNQNLCLYLPVPFQPFTKVKGFFRLKLNFVWIIFQFYCGWMFKNLQLKRYVYISLKVRPSFQI